jgi:hypothetical protein
MMNRQLIKTISTKDGVAPIFVNSNFDAFELTLIKVIEQIESSPIGRTEKKSPPPFYFLPPAEGNKVAPFFRSIK